MIRLYYILQCELISMWLTDLRLNIFNKNVFIYKFLTISFIYLMYNAIIVFIYFILFYYSTTLQKYSLRSVGHQVTVASPWKYSFVIADLF